MFDNEAIVPYIALMVSVDDYNTVEYGMVEIIGTELPTNDSETIRYVVDLANSRRDKNSNITFVDMYGFSYLGKKVLWEVAGTEEEFGGWNYD